ncbi:MAG: hypothetical protein KAU01_02555 [Candidatus Cloacimonetes bacterium]|nr:hypothetical protein [Candidatus Cloacimonadota bacterium]
MKKNIKIAIPTNNGKTIFPKMLGQAKEFRIYSLNDKEVIFIEKRNNPFENTLHSLKTLDVYEIISDCDVIISNKIGKKGIKRLEEREMKLFLEMEKFQMLLKN